MAGFDAQVQQAISALKAGRRDEARDLLLHVVDQDERNEQAWLYLSGLVETLEEQEICLENVLALNPSNQKALKGLEAIRSRTAPPPPPPMPRRGAPSPQARPAPVPPIELNPYSDQPFDEWLKSAASPYGAAQQPASDALPTSVDWSRDSGNTVYGSGRNIPSPSPQEYDEWVQGLNLDEPAAPVPPVFDQTAIPPAPAPRPDMRRSGPFASRLPPDRQAAPGEIPPPDWAAEFAEPPAWGTAPASPTPFAAPFADPFPEGDEDLFVDDAPAVADRSDPFAGQVAETVDDFAAVPTPFEAPAADADWLGESAAEQRAPALAPVPAEAAPARATESDYYRYIPSEIEASESGGSRILLLTLLVIVLLIALNLISYAYWLA